MLLIFSICNLAPIHSFYNEVNNSSIEKFNCNIFAILYIMIFEFSVQLLILIMN